MSVIPFPAHLLPPRKLFLLKLEGLLKVLLELELFRCSRHNRFLDFDSFVSTSSARLREVLNSSSTSPQPNHTPSETGIAWQHALDSLHVFRALWNLLHGNYDKAARSFIQCVNLFVTTQPLYLSTHDYVFYMTLCALATLDVKAISDELLSNPELSSYFDRPPFLGDLIRDYIKGRFQNLMRFLDACRMRFSMDPFLYEHAETLVQMIAKRALIGVLNTFSAVTFKKIASLTGIAEMEVDKILKKYIADGLLDAKLNMVDKILHVSSQDPRKKTYRRALEVGERLEQTER